MSKNKLLEPEVWKTLPLFTAKAPSDRAKDSLDACLRRQPSFEFRRWVVKGVDRLVARWELSGEVFATAIDVTDETVEATYESMILDCRSIIENQPADPSTKPPPTYFEAIEDMKAWNESQRHPDVLIATLNHLEECLKRRKAST